MRQGATLNTKKTIGTSSTAILDASGGELRQVIYLKNTGTTTISVTFGNTEAVAGEGVVLSAGEYIVDSIVGNYCPWQGVINAISDGAGGTLAIYVR